MQVTNDYRAEHPDDEGTVIAVGDVISRDGENVTYRLDEMEWRGYIVRELPPDELLVRAY